MSLEVSLFKSLLRWCFESSNNMCVNHVNMVPVYYNILARQSCGTGMACAKCRALSTNEKSLEYSELWKTRHSVPVNVSQPEVPATQSPFKILRKGAATRDVNSTQQVFKKDQDENNKSLLEFLAIHALDLTAPASDVLLKNRQKYQWSSANNQCSSNKNQWPGNWFQLSGHPGSFAPAGPGTVWKKRAGDPDDTERQVYEHLSSDPLLKDIVPKYYREVFYEGEKFLELQDLLHGFQDPYMMDIKMGTRTFLESEVQKSTARKDLYEKMVAIDPNAPTEEEHAQQAVTKLRYMQFREQQSSTCSQGFRIEAMKMRGAPPVTDLKTIKTRPDVSSTMGTFLNGREDVRQRLLSRLREIRAKFEQSEYFQRHEVVGSSIFMIYDDSRVGVWLIDFAKTHPVPDGITLTHRKKWARGNHEEGFLFGLDRLITVLDDISFAPSSWPSMPKSVSTVPVES